VFKNGAAVIYLPLAGDERFEVQGLAGWSTIVRVQPGGVPSDLLDIRGMPTFFWPLDGGWRLWPAPDRELVFRVVKVAPVSWGEGVKSALENLGELGGTRHAEIPEVVRTGPDNPDYIAWQTHGFVQVGETPMSRRRLKVIRDGADAWAGPYTRLVLDLCDAAELAACLTDAEAADLSAGIGRYRGRWNLQLDGEEMSLGTEDTLAAAAQWLGMQLDKRAQPKVDTEALIRKLEAHVEYPGEVTYRDGLTQAESQHLLDALRAEANGR
jgi:hypothetical protein